MLMSTFRLKQLGRSSPIVTCFPLPRNGSMIDLVIRPLAGLLLCAAFVAVLLALPNVIRHVRVWVAQIREGNLPAPVLSLIRQREEPAEEPAAERKAS
jgi:hypothetical protein